MFKVYVPAVAAALLLAACGSTQDTGGTVDTSASTAPQTTQQPTVDQTAVAGPRPGTQEELNATVGDRVFFAFDSAELSAGARDTAEDWAEWLRRYPALSVTVEGHADERGTREYNLALGDRRATAVKNYLVALGVGEGRVRTVSFGKERPAVLGSNEQAWAQNRRSVMVVN